jgi:exopolysaccharide biosynthesis polyprenyl glycosylphosphotransferase
MESDVQLRREPAAPGRFRRPALLRLSPSWGGVPRAIEDGRGRIAVERREALYRRALACADVISAVLALVLCVHLFGDDTLRPTSLLALPLIVAVSKVKGLYDRDELLIRKTTMDEAPQLFQLATLYALILWLLEGVVITGDLGKTQVLVLWGTMWTSAFIGRRIARTVASRIAAPERILFVGDASAYARLRSKLDADGLKAALVGRMSLQRAVRARGGDRSHDVTELRELIRWTDAHRVIIEPQVLPADDMLEFVRAAKAVGVRVSLLPRVFDVVGTSVVFDELDGMTVLGVRRFGLTRSSRATKRAFDLVGATAMLVVLGPLMALIALAIKLDSRGPVLFRQTRVGRDGMLFRICKFRTMVDDAESLKEELRVLNEAAGGLFKISDDPRITRVGRLLRKTSLDELPQLFNVVRGDMSLVGPRPLVRDEDELVTGLDRRRLSLTPGMTGHWQILGSSRVPLPEMVKIDYLYVAGWSLWTDLKILLRTVPYMLRRRGQ